MNTSTGNHSHIAWLKKANVCVCVCVHLCVYVHLCVCALCVCICVCMCMYVHVHLSVCVLCVCAMVCTCKYVRTCYPGHMYLYCYVHVCNMHPHTRACVYVCLKASTQCM